LAKPSNNLAGASVEIPQNWEVLLELVLQPDSQSSYQELVIQPKKFIRVKKVEMDSIEKRVLYLEERLMSLGDK